MRIICWVRSSGDAAWRVVKAARAIAAKRRRFMVERVAEGVCFRGFPALASRRRDTRFCGWRRRNRFLRLRSGQALRVRATRSAQDDIAVGEKQVLRLRATRRMTLRLGKSRSFDCALPAPLRMTSWLGEKQVLRLPLSLRERVRSG